MATGAGLFDTAATSAFVMGVTYGLVRLYYAASRDLAASIHWKPSWGGWVAFWVVMAGVYLGDVWANDHTRDCFADYPAARLMDRNDSRYWIITACEDDNRVQRRARVIAVVLVLGIASASGLQAGRTRAASGSFSESKSWSHG